MSETPDDGFCEHAHLVDECEFCKYEQEIERLRAEVKRLEQSVYAADTSVADLTVMLEAERQRVRLPDGFLKRVVDLDCSDLERGPWIKETGRLLRDILAAVDGD